jgi:hypothetical protein
VIREAFRPGTEPTFDRSVLGSEGVGGNQWIAPDRGTRGLY